MSEPVPLFIAVSIQTNQRCNMACRFCYYGQYPRYQTDESLPTALIEKIFSELAGAGYHGRLALYNMNDPLTDERIVGLLQSARSMLPDCRHYLSTNGRLLTQGLLDAILECVDVLRVNDYGGLPELDFSSPKVDLRDKRAFWGRADNNRGGSLHGLPSAHTAGPDPCANPFGQLVVVPPGVVVLCCSDGFRQEVMGDVRRTGIVDIWRGSRFQEIRRRLAAGLRKNLALCRGCSVRGGGFLEYFDRPELFHMLFERFRRGDYDGSIPTRSSIEDVSKAPAGVQREKE